MLMNIPAETIIRSEIPKLRRSIAKLEGMLPGAASVYEFEDCLAVRATDIYGYVVEAGGFDLDGDDVAEPKVVTGYVVSDPYGYEEFESEFMGEASEYLDSRATRTAGSSA